MTMTASCDHDFFIFLSMTSYAETTGISLEYGLLCLYNKMTG